jgi:hypothetical protein
MNASNRFLLSNSVLQLSLQVHSPQFGRHPMPTPTLTKFRLHLSDGSIAFACEPEAAHALDTALTNLLASFKAAVANNTQTNGALPPLEFRHNGAVFFEVFCNPNIWPNPFAAKLLITIKDANMHLSTEADLAQLRDDLSSYLEQIA